MLTNVLRYSLSPSPSQNLSQSLKLTDLVSPHPNLVPRDRAYGLGLRSYVLPLESRDKGRDEMGGTNFHFP